MLITIDPGSPVALHEQIAAAARRAILNGDLRAGDRLPPARSLAESLQVNMHTVLRAYTTLREEGLIELRRGRGAVVLDRSATAEFGEAARRFVQLARDYGLTPSQVHAAVDEGFAR